MLENLKPESSLMNNVDSISHQVRSPRCEILKRMKRAIQKKVVVEHRKPYIVVVLFFSSLNSSNQCMFPDIFISIYCLSFLTEIQNVISIDIVRFYPLHFHLLTTQ